MPVAPTAAPAATEPAAGSPAPTSVSVSNTASTTLAPTVTRIAALRPAYRPTMVAPIISARPISSLRRVWRTIARVLMKPASTARNVSIWNMPSAPVLAPVGALRSRRSAGLSTTPRRAPMRSASVGYCSLVADRETASMAVVPATQIGSWTRSRRSVNRVSRAVPANEVIGAEGVVMVTDLIVRPPARRRSGA